MAFHGPIRALLLITAIALCSCDSPTQEVAPAPGTTDTCQSLAPPANVEFSQPPNWVESDRLPKYCRVRGTVDGYVRFEMRLPEAWNGRFMMAGCGGFCGELKPDKPGHSNAINEALKRGYAAISHDSGHQAKSWETHWARDREALVLWAHKVLPVVAGVGNSLIMSLYGEPAHHRYFSGCSNGGRLGLMAAQRYPDLFDGIAAGASIFDLSGIAGLWGNWLITQTHAAEGSRFPPDKVPLIQELVMGQCDEADGRKDTIIGDPRACTVDFRVAQCADDGVVADDCLRAEEIEVLERLYGGVQNSDREIIYPAAPYGSEHYSDIWLFGTEANPAWGVLASAGYRELLASDLAEEDFPQGISTDRMIEWISRSSIPALTDATDSDLSRLRETEGKLLIYQGWSDPLIVPEPIVRYYEQAMDAAGGLAELQTYARLLMVPGWGHCWERPALAPDDFDPLQVLEQWVEHGLSPDYIVASQHGPEGEVLRSRRVCAYPATAQLVDIENPDSQESYECVTGHEVNGD